MWLYVFSSLCSSLFRSFDKRAKVHDYGNQFFSWRSANQPFAFRKTFFFSPCNRMGDNRGFQGETWPPAASIIALLVEKNE